MSESVSFPLEGTVPVFPLPNAVFFPHTLIPLHIFEPRYREMVADAIAGERRIAMALLRDGWESDYEGRPPIHPVGCLGRISREERLPNGRWNIVLLGLARVRFLQENGDQPYRIAGYEVVQDASSPLDPQAREVKRRRLVELFLRLTDRQGAPADALIEAFRKIEPLGALADLVASALPLDVPAKQRLLEEPDPLARFETLLDFLERQGASPVPARRRRLPYPPPQNLN